jgi:hypothetical protein
MLFYPYMKLHEIRCHFQEISHRRDRGDRRVYLIFFFSAISAFSAVNCYVSSLIILVASAAELNPEIPEPLNPEPLV